MTERWITVDPGEDCGLAVWEDDRLILGYTLKMEVVDLMLHFSILETGPGKAVEFRELYPECEDFMDQIEGYKIVRIVCEDWRLYPWVMYTPDGRASHALDFDQCRTARLIGAITHVARLAGIPVHLQGADIKETAVAAGAEQLYYKPLHENRHQNDAIQHGVYWLVIEESRAPKDARI
jgi:hypothetical protein